MRRIGLIEIETKLMNQLPFYQNNLGLTNELNQLA